MIASAAAVKRSKESSGDGGLFGREVQIALCFLDHRSPATMSTAGRWPKFWFVEALRDGCAYRHSPEPLNNPGIAYIVRARVLALSLAAARCPARRFGEYRSQGTGLPDIRSRR
jgi:hypothetical protein